MEVSWDLTCKLGPFKIKIKFLRLRDMLTTTSFFISQFPSIKSHSHIPIIHSFLLTHSLLSMASKLGLIFSLKKKKQYKLKIVEPTNQSDRLKQCSI